MLGKRPRLARRAIIRHHRRHARPRRHRRRPAHCAAHLLYQEAARRPQVSPAKARSRPIQAAAPFARNGYPRVRGRLTRADSGHSLPSRTVVGRVRRHRQKPVSVISPRRSRRPDEINLGVGAGLAVAEIDRLRTDDPVQPVWMSSAAGVHPVRPRYDSPWFGYRGRDGVPTPPAPETPLPDVGGVAYRIERQTANLLIFNVAKSQCILVTVGVRGTCVGGGDMSGRSVPAQPASGCEGSCGSRSWRKNKRGHSRTTPVLGGPGKGGARPVAPTPCRLIPRRRVATGVVDFQRLQVGEPRRQPF